MNQTYKFDSFQENHKKSEIDRLTKNVDSHSKALCEHFLSNGLLSAKSVLDVGCGTGAMLEMFSSILPDIDYVGIDNSDDILKKQKRTPVSTKLYLLMEKRRDFLLMMILLILYIPG
ncbi:methyltransferase domain-containing protein [Paenibacillus lemnae]|uniref:Methyltransferase domain-containing protein n=1 Tax=Paenibacillus lemnae TaxID=1330551 RepID=A0A848MAV5_PAELE|nr:class I SAM-dependent methyltransferase [Paenibacillus lemnae]NMO96594.1 methyltransferase domain-containing protein [Paenibacillus lemnae]